MNPSVAIGNTCVAIATFIFLWPLQRLLRDYARKETSNDQWVKPVVLLLIPQWLLLMGALLSVTASGGFDSPRLGGPTLYAFIVAAALALAVVSFVFIALYLRPGFTPRFLYRPVIYLVHFATVLLVVLSLNPSLGISTQWLRWPWTIFAAFSIIASAGFFGYLIVRSGVGGLGGIARRIRNPGPSSAEVLAHIATLDPTINFKDLLRGASRHESRAVRDAATARLRSNPNFLEQLSTELETGDLEPAVGFLCDTELTPAEQARAARSARKAMQRWVNRIPAPNYTTKKNLADLRRWGTEMFRVLPEKFASTGVDFASVIEDFKDKVGPVK